MLEGMSRQYFDLLKSKGGEAANQMLFDQSRRFSQVFRASRPPAAVGRRKSTVWRSVAALELTLSCHYRVAAENPKPGSDCRK